MVHARLTNIGGAGIIPSSDSTDVAFLTATGINQYPGVTNAFNDSNHDILLLIPQNAGSVNNFEIVIHSITNTATTGATVVATLWQPDITLSGSTLTYSGPTSAADITLTIPSGTNDVWGSSSVSLSVTTVTVLAISIATTNITADLGLLSMLRYEVLLS